MQLDQVCIPDAQDPSFKSLVKTDLSQMVIESQLSLQRDLYEALLVQSVLGHAQKGHKAFFQGGVRYPSATITDILEAADLDVEKIKSKRQRLIDEVFDWAELAQDDKTNRLLLKGKPLLGIGFFQNMEVDPWFVLKGLALAGCMDNYGWRMKTFDRFGGRTREGKPLDIGGGETYLVEAEVLWERLQENSLYIEQLGLQGHTDADLLQLQPTLTTDSSPSAEVIYVRRKAGLGTSDDTAMIMGGVMMQQEGEKQARSTLLGIAIGDGLDTYDKCVLHPVTGGYDELLALQLREELPDLVSDEEIMQLIYSAAKGNGKYVVSSSHKRLIQIMPGADPLQTTIEHHLKFLEQGNYPRFRIGFERMASEEFYGEVRRRMEQYQAACL
ncbi:hypothetical protein HYS49_02485 [Candidatus Woesearchaeota archaeon]|nr:hypothetical protein [Candidatus Woesearchaeota archaeon]